MSRLSCEPEQWRPAPAPSAERLLVRGVRDLLGEQLGLLRWPCRLSTSPAGAARETAAGLLRVTRALSHSLRAAPASVLNDPLSPLRRLAWTERPLGDLRDVKRTYGTSINDVCWRRSPGAMRAYLLRRGEQPVALKAMVPVNVRRGEDERLVTASRSCSPSSPATSPTRSSDWTRARDDEPAQAQRRARGSRPRAQGRRAHPGRRCSTNLRG